MLDSTIPYYLLRLGNRLCYEITFNDYNRVINSTGAKQDVSYKISDTSLEYEIVTTQPYLTSCVSGEYQNMVLPYDRVLRHKQIRVNKSDLVGHNVKLVI